LAISPDLRTGKYKEFDMATFVKSSVREEVMGIIASSYNVDSEQIDDETRFLSIGDIPDFFAALYVVADSFPIDVRFVNQEKLPTVRDLVNYVDKELSSRS